MNILRSAVGTSRDNDSTIWSGASTGRSASEGIFAGGVGIQLLYHVLMNIWQLSFEAELVGRGLNEYGLTLKSGRRIALFLTAFTYKGV